MGFQYLLEKNLKSMKGLEWQRIGEGNCDQEGIRNRIWRENEQVYLWSLPGGALWITEFIPEKLPRVRMATTKEESNLLDQETVTLFQLLSLYLLPISQSEPPTACSLWMFNHQCSRALHSVHKQYLTYWLPIGWHCTWQDFIWFPNYAIWLATFMP